MNFRLVCVLGFVVTAVFGLGFLLLPELVSSLYGISGWNQGTTVIARLYGGGLLFVASATFAVKGTLDLAIQRSFSFSFAVVSLVCAVLSLQSVTSGSTNAFMWSAVAIFASFVVMWFLAARGARGSSRAAAA
jgi:hypothetical protein